MKRFLLALLLVVCCLGIASAEDSGARFSSLSGQVEVRPDLDKKAWSYAKMNTVLNVDDHVKTGDDSSAILGFADMSTFLLKAESEIIVSSPPAKDSKIKLVAGNIWVNVKKMAKDGTMEVDMSQAVAGIKGTNITCQTNQGEDRIQVLRGLAEILIKESQERISLKEGEELIVHTGGKSEKIEINIKEESKKWEKELSKMGDSIQLNDVPDTLRQIQQSEGEAFGAVQDRFKSLSAASTVSEEDVQAFRKDAERFTGIVMEDLVIFIALQMKIDTARVQAPPSQQSQIAGYQKMLGDARGSAQKYQAEVSKMLKVDFRKAGGTSAEVTALQEQVAATWGAVDTVLREVQSTPSGLAQDWFDGALDRCNQALKELGEQAAQVQAALERNPNDKVAQALIKQIGSYQSQISTMMRDFAVVKIDGSTLTEMQEVDDHLSSSISALRVQIDQYNTIVSNAQAEARLRASLSILNDFSKARRLYTNAQRLYDSIMRSASSQKFRTAEQEEMTQTYDRITNTYQQLGIAAEDLQSRLQDLEGQLGKFLK